MQLTSILKTKAAYWANLQVMMSMDWKKPDFGVYYYLQLADTVNIFWRMYLYVLLKTNVEIKEKENENAAKAAKTMWRIYYARQIDCKLQICPWQNECQQSMYNFRSCKSNN